MNKEEIIKALDTIKNALTEENKEHSNTDFEWSPEYIELNTNKNSYEDSVIKKLYTIKRSYSPNVKCNKCNNNRLIKKDNTFVSEFNTCDCMYDNIEYSVSELDVIAETKSQYIIHGLYDDTGINKDIVFDTFNESNPNNCFYTSEEECQKHCDFLGGRE